MTSVADHGDSRTPVREDGMAIWRGGEADDPWQVELEEDTFDLEEGPMVSLYVVNARGTSGRTDESGLASLTPDQARAIATELVHLADHVERRRAE